MTYETEWLRTEEMPHPNKNAKTKLLRVMAKKNGALLGHVTYLGFWRQYAFFPNVYTAYEPDCLRAIASFLDTQMQEWRDSKKKQVP